VFAVRSDDPAARRLRSVNATIAALSRWSREDGVTGTEPARKAGPGQLEYWAREVDPNGQLTERERERRAKAAKRAHFLRLARKSAEARRRPEAGA
jgi:hypothetical protein